MKIEQSVQGQPALPWFGTTTESWFNLHYNRFVESLMLLLNYIPKSSKILDVGCSPGYLTSAIKLLGFNVKGVDLDPDTVTKFNNIEVKKCNIEEEILPFNDDTFDCIIFSEVLEHISYNKIQHTLDELHRVLKKSGFLLMSTPNLACIENRVFLLFGGCQFLGGGIINPHHVREYTMKEIRNMLDRSNFVIVEEKYSMCRDSVTHITNDLISREYVLKKFFKYRHWINYGRVLALPLKRLFCSFRTTIFVVAKARK